MNIIEDNWCENLALEVSLLKEGIYFRNCVILTLGIALIYAIFLLITK